MPIERLRRPAVGALTLEQLRTLITSGEWPVGHRLPGEQHLADELGVGRSTVREAVRALVHAGLLDARPGDGTFVCASDEVSGALTRHLRGAHILEIYEVRKALEIEAAKLAAVRRSETDLARMTVALHDRLTARAGGTVRELLAADMDFHAAVVDAAANPVLSTIYRSFMSSLREALVPVVEQNLQEQDTDQLHQELFDSILRKDPNGAVHATQAHLASTARGLALVR